jgi:hypothetical protein
MHSTLCIPVFVVSLPLSLSLSSRHADDLLGCSSSIAVSAGDRHTKWMSSGLLVVYCLLLVLQTYAFHGMSRLFHRSTATTLKKVLGGACAPRNSVISRGLSASLTPKNNHITPRSDDFSAWYSDLLTASDMVDQSPVRGCMVIKPWGMGVWDQLRSELDRRIRDTDTQNAYFPLFIPLSFLAKEAQHVDGFAKECAVVTHHRLCASPEGLVPDPDAKLEVLTIL